MSIFSSLRAADVATLAGWAREAEELEAKAATIRKQMDSFQPGRGPQPAPVEAQKPVAKRRKRRKGDSGAHILDCLRKAPTEGLRAAAIAKTSGVSYMSAFLFLKRHVGLKTIIKKGQLYSLKA